MRDSQNPRRDVSHALVAAFTSMTMAHIIRSSGGPSIELQERLGPRASVSHDETIAIQRGEQVGRGKRHRGGRFGGPSRGIQRRGGMEGTKFVVCNTPSPTGKRKGTLFLP